LSLLDEVSKRDDERYTYFAKRDLMTIFFLTILMIKILTELSPLPLNDTVVLDESLNSSICSCSDWLLSSSQFELSVNSNETSWLPSLS